MVHKFAKDCQSVQSGLGELFSENTVAKILRTASQELYKNVSKRRFWTYCKGCDTD